MPPFPKFHALSFGSLSRPPPLFFARCARSKMLSPPLGYGSPCLAAASRGSPSSRSRNSGRDVREPGTVRTLGRPGCAGPRDSCRPRSRLTPRAPPQLTGRCHPPRSGCRLSPRAQTLGPRLQAPRQLPRVSAHGGARPGPERAASVGRGIPVSRAFSPSTLTFWLYTHLWWAQPDSLHPILCSSPIPESEKKTFLTRLSPKAPNSVPGAQLVLNSSPTSRA